MNAGKTTALLQVAHNYERNGETVVIAKPGIDDKGGSSVVSRLGIEREVDILATPDMDLRMAILAKTGGGIIQSALVDEAQFLTREQVDQLRMLATFDGITTMAFGLRTDFQTRLFPGSARLFEVADKIEEIKTMCRCMGQKAVFNARYYNGQFATTGEQVEIDNQAEVTYEPLCPKCYLDETNK